MAVYCISEARGSPVLTFHSRGPQVEPINCGKAHLVPYRIRLPHRRLDHLLSLLTSGGTQDERWIRACGLERIMKGEWGAHCEDMEGMRIREVIAPIMSTGQVQRGRYWPLRCEPNSKVESKVHQIDRVNAFHGFRFQISLLQCFVLSSFLFPSLLFVRPASAGQ